VLFLIFIDDLEDGIRNMVYKFADDTKVLAQVQSDAGRKNYKKISIHCLSGLKNGKCLLIQRRVELYMYEGQIKAISTVWKVRLWIQLTVRKIWVLGLVPI